jgi:hypothetical protein
MLAWAGSAEKKEDVCSQTVALLLLAALVTEWFVFKQWVVICCLTRGKRNSFLMNKCNYIISNIYFLK